MNAKVLSYTGRYANLVGYDPENTKTEKVPIVTALIKVRSSSSMMYPILLKVHEAPYMINSPITLLSEYQIRDYGLVIDSVAKKHQAGPSTNGTQHFQVKKEVHIDFEDRGGLMGFELLPINKDDKDIYDIIPITSPTRWIPSKYISNKDTSAYFYDPSDLNHLGEEGSYPNQVNHLSNSHQNIEEKELLLLH